jgi:hypothetical protein
MAMGDSRMLRRWLVLGFVCGCRAANPAPTASSTSAAPAPPPSETPIEAPPAASAAPPESEPAAAPKGDFADHSAAALISECIERTWLGYTCNNAYAAAPKLFAADAPTIQTLMKLAVRAGAGKPLGGEAEVVSACNVEKGEGDAYPCLYLAEGNRTAEQKKAHALACKGAPAEGQVPVAGGTAACDGDKPIQIVPLPKREADDVKRCLACGHDPKVSNRDLKGLASAKACAAVRKRLAAREATYVEKTIEPLCPKGS